ncbi:hypothetical protein [Halosegnis longus]|uniref:DUF8115 domain-containing protein n=1 Tax=Halosegnis longus TaxID=2216012 RepID=A0AAJ4R5V6_9EURY|nr:hypothetical protein Nmn1133_14060 [Salella cibi]
MSEDKLDELRQESQRGSRLDEDSTTDRDLIDDISGAMDDIEDGDRRKTVAVRDKSMAALLTALDDDEHTERMQEVGDALSNALGRSTSDNYDRSELVRLALRLGFQRGSPDVVEELQTAHQEHTSEQF